MDGKKILIADDDSEIREVLRLLLSGEGYQDYRSHQRPQKC